MDTDKCDFCAQPPVWVYPCKDFILEVDGMGSSGAWYACEVCHGLIEAGDYNGLSKRCIDLYPGKLEPGFIPLAIHLAQTSQRQFAEHRNGPCYPLAN